MGITRRAFWLGNSMTYRPHSAAQKYGINVPHVLQIIAQANGDDHIFDWSVSGGSSICWHIHRFNLTRALAAANYDAIVMQSIHGPCDKVTCIWPCAQEIVEIARANGVPQVALRASWAKPRDGDLLAGLDRRVHESVVLSTRLGGVRIIQEGVPWEVLRQRQPELWQRCFSEDNFHPSALGTYLNALHSYHALFDGAIVRHGSSLVLPTIAGVSAADAAALAAAVTALLPSFPFGDGDAPTVPPPSPPTPPPSIGWRHEEAVGIVAGTAAAGVLIGVAVGWLLRSAAITSRRKSKSGVSAKGVATASTSAAVVVDDASRNESEL